MFVLSVVALQLNPPLLRCCATADFQLSSYFMEQNVSLWFDCWICKSQYLCVIVFIERECVESDFGGEPPVGVSLDSSVLCQRQDGAQTHLFN